MPHKAKPGTTRIDLDISPQAQLRFAALHETLGYRSKTETFEAIVYFAAMQDKIDPHVLERIERRLEDFMEIMEAVS